MQIAPRVVWMPGGVRTEIHLVGEDTDGAFCLLVDHPPAAWSLPAHLHRGVAETIHILEGEFEMTVEGKRSRLKAGETMHLPSEVTHASSNVGGVHGRRIVIFSPAGMESFFMQLGAAARGLEAAPAAALACATGHGWHFTDSRAPTERAHR